MHNVLGGTIDPHAAYLMLRGMKTLDVRVQRQNQVTQLRLSWTLQVQNALSRGFSNPLAHQTSSNYSLSLA